MNILDGLGMDIGSSWILIRPSGTELIIRIIAEFPLEIETERLLEYASTKLRKLAEV